MGKRFLAVVLAAAMAFSMAGCGKAETAGSSSSAKTETKVKIGLISDVGGINDGSFNESAWKGLQKAESELGISAKYLESSTDADYAPNLETFIDEKYDLIICVGYQLSDALRTAAEAHPDQKFAILDDTSCKDLSNVTCLMFEQAQVSYLAGYVAGLTTKSNVVGFVEGMATDTMHQFGYGYCAGVADSNPSAKILQANANSFADTAAGKTAANNMIAEHADVIFHAAGGTGLGVIDACKEAGIWAIGVDSDQSSIAPGTILTSAMKRVDTACYDVAKETQDGTLKGGIQTYSLKEEGVDLAPTTDNLNPDVLDRVNQVKEKIISGEITVPSDKQAFEAKYGNIYELD